MWQGWTEETTGTMVKLWGEGLSATIIAERISAPSRNAVIGKAYRMGLAERATHQRRPMRPRPKRQAPRIKPKATSSPLSLLRHDPTPLPPPYVTDIPRVSILMVENHHCRWVCADFTSMEAPMYCGCKSMTGLPYCENHARRAFALPEASKRPNATAWKRKTEHTFVADLHTLEPTS